MYKGKKIIGLIPARGGSKGLLRKNSKPLIGKPLIAWTIESALESRYLDKLLVSTDDEEIANISIKYGAEVPFIRPGLLSTDNAKMIDVILHTVNWLEDHGLLFDLIMLLQPTSPLRTTNDIDNIVEFLFSKNAMASVSVCKANNHPYWTNTLPYDGCLGNFLRPEVRDKNRQEISATYRLNGALYLAYIDYLKNTMSFIGKEAFAYIMPNERSVDIDDELDFRFVEFLLNNSSLQHD